MPSRVDKTNYLLRDSFLPHQTEEEGRIEVWRERFRREMELLLYLVINVQLRLLNSLEYFYAYHTKQTFIK